MIIHCPLCATNFLIGKKVAKKKQGLLKCGNCGYLWHGSIKEKISSSIFNALIYLFFAVLILLEIDAYLS